MSRFEFVDNQDLIKAIELRASECFPAMNIANALGGSETIAWRLVRSSSLSELIEEAISRKIELKEIKSAVDKKPLLETKAYMDLSINIIK